MRRTREGTRAQLESGAARTQAIKAKVSIEADTLQRAARGGAGHVRAGAPQHDGCAHRVAPRHHLTQGGLHEAPCVHRYPLTLSVSSNAPGLSLTATTTLTATQPHGSGWQASRKEANESFAKAIEVRGQYEEALQQLQAEHETAKALREQIDELQATSTISAPPSQTSSRSFVSRPR